MSAQSTQRREYGKDRAERVTFRLSESERAELQRLAAREGLSLAEYVRAHLIRERGSIDRPTKAKP